VAKSDPSVSRFFYSTGVDFNKQATLVSQSFQQIKLFNKNYLFKKMNKAMRFKFMFFIKRSSLFQFFCILVTTLTPDQEPDFSVPVEPESGFPDTGSEVIRNNETGLIDFGQAIRNEDGRLCLPKTEFIESVIKEPVVECVHKLMEKCHYTYVTQFTPSQVREPVSFKLRDGSLTTGPTPWVVRHIYLSLFYPFW